MSSLEGRIVELEGCADTNPTNLNLLGAKVGVKPLPVTFLPKGTRLGHKGQIIVLQNPL